MHSKRPLRVKLRLASRREETCNSLFIQLRQPYHPLQHILPSRNAPLPPPLRNFSISTICNLPIGPFAGASREGWGNYFRELHGHMRTRKNTTTSTTSHHRGPLPTKRAAVRSSPARTRRRPPERRGKLGRQQRPPPATQSAGNSNRNGAYRTANINDKQQKNDPDDVAAAKARATRRAAEESVVWRMAVRLRTLWQELKIPEPDREYITAKYLGGGGTPGAVNATGTGPGRDTEGIPTTSDETYLELVRQIRLLLDYRVITIKVNTWYLEPHKGQLRLPSFANFRAASRVEVVVAHASLR